jgi:dienelactone hydrolase
MTIARIDQGSWASWLEAAADADGRIDTRTAVPLRGTYEGADVEGLFWSMTKLDAPGPRTGWHVTVSEASGDDSAAMPELASADLSLQITAPGTTTVDVADDGLVGRLFLPAGASPASRPPVAVILSGSEGGLASTVMTSAALAARGYASLSLAWFGAPGLPQELAEIPLEYFQTAFQWLAARPDVDASRLAVVGVSRGGELALLLGATFPQVKAVVARVPSHIRWGGNPDDDGSGMEGPSRPAFTFGGKGLAYLESTGELDEVALPDGTTAFVNTPAFQRGLAAATPAQIASATTPIERTRGPILMIGGSDDQVWPSCDNVAAAMQRLRARKHAYADEAICAQGAGHGVTGEPGLATTELAFEHPHMHKRLFTGGTAAANAAGQRLAWDRTMAVLERALHPAHP